MLARCIAAFADTPARSVPGRPFPSRLRMLAACALLAILSGCTSVAEIRVHHDAGAEPVTIDAQNPADGCTSAGSTTDARAHSIENYDGYWGGFVEFDDEGWLYSSHGQPNQMQVVQARLSAELADPRFDADDFLVVAFVHGWHHNAHDTDCNVHEFRALLKVAHDRYAEAVAADPQRLPRRVVGIYVGWRGESIPVAGLSATTVLDRRNAAERVAKGDVRELFALLRKLQVGESRKTDPAGGPMRPDRMRTVVVGHSFGGLIAFNGLSQAVLNELTLTKPQAGQDCFPTVRRAPAVLMQNGVRVSKAATETAATAAERIAPVFPDMLILVNPAFEATRFETLHALMRPDGCAYPEDRPKVVVVTADNDWATGPVFHAGRTALTLLEAYPREGGTPDGVSREREANTHAIGFVPRYQTHRLCVVDDDGPPHAVAVQTPGSSEWPPDRYAPVWVVRAPPRIVNGHDGFLFAEPEAGQQHPWLLDWLVGLHLFGPDDHSPVMARPGQCPVAMQ